MKTLVIGGTRYFGKRLVNLLAEEGHEVTMVSRGQAPTNFPADVKQLVCDRKDTEKLARLMKGLTWDCVIDQICMTAADAKGAVEIFSGKTLHYVMTSTQSVYDAGADLVESDFQAKGYEFEDGENPAYKEAKRQAESVLTRATGFATSFARIPIVLGEDDYTGRLKFHVERVAQGKPIFFPNLEARISFIDSASAAENILLLAKTIGVGPVNLAAETPMRLKDLLLQIEQVARREPVFAKAAGEQDHSPFGIDKDWFMNVEKAHKLGIRARDVGEWLPKLVIRLAEEAV